MSKLVVLFVLLACTIGRPVRKFSFDNLYELNFDLTKEEMRTFEKELSGIFDQLFVKWRVSNHIFTKNTVKFNIRL